ncbi:nucleolar protein 14 homolog [Planococcus citri]|uniref:nucleolar protein 14 homolog n=1 Tax=Planococcus citri TaxID=170843 RepID=UPI0031F944BF
MKKNKNRKMKNMTNKDRVLSKFTTGRTKSIKKRKNTLLLEYKLQNKANKFFDRRIGEKNRNMTAEDRVMARFVAHRVKTNKKELFNLGGDEEVLTHQGRSLQDVEKFDTPVDESDEEEDDGRLDASFVKEAHFGGGLFTKVTPESSSHQSTIDMLIAESKRKKAERQQTKEETQNLTEKLDNDLKDLFPLVTDSKKDADEGFKPNHEPYDVLVRELKFEPVGRPSDKLKSEDQVRNEERQRLEKLEKERLERMKRTIEPTAEDADEPPQKKHQSADDLDDGLDLDVFDEEDDDNDDEDEDDQSEQDDDDQNDNEEEENDESENSEDEDEEKKETPSTSKLTEIEKPPLKKSKSFVPGSISALKELLGENDTDGKIKLIKEAVKNQQVHAGVSNVDHLMQFFRILLQYLDELFHESLTKESWIFASKLTPVLFDLVQVSGENAAQIVFDIIKRKHEAFSSDTKQGATPDMLLVLKLVPILFPTSDYYHPVATPATAFLARVISQNSCKNGQFIAEGLFLATLMLEYISLSNRYCPEAVNFLKCVLYTAVPNTQEAIPPVNSKNKSLTLKKNYSKKNLSPENLQLSYSSLSSEADLNDEDKLKFIFTALKLLSAYVKHYESFSASYAIWKPILKQLEQLPIETYPKCCSDEVSELKTKISATLSRPIQYLVAQRKRPKALRLYEPNIRQVIDGQSFRTTSQAKQEHDKLLHQYKREMKGALREIRKDRSFIARVKVSEQAQKDAERKAKVKQILNWGQGQQSELKRMERKNRYRH